MDKHLKQLLKASFDRELTAEEDSALSNALEISLELQEEKKQLEKIREVLKNHRPAFRSAFVDGLITKINQERESRLTRGIVVAFNRIALPLLAAASILLLFSIVKDGGLSIESIIGIDNLEPMYLSEFLLFNY